MAIKILLFKTLSFLINQVFSALQASNQSEERCTIKAENLIITSNNLSDLNLKMGTKNLKLEDFKLKNKTQGNALIFPLFELRDEKINKLPKDFKGHIFFNDFNFNKNHKLCKDSYNVDSRAVFTRKGVDTVVDYNFDCHLFILENPETNVLNLYMFVYSEGKDLFGFDGNNLKVGKDVVDHISCLVSLEKDTDGIEFKHSRTGKYPDYFLSTKYDINSYIDLYFTKFNDQTISLSYMERPCDYIIIKPQTVPLKEQNNDRLQAPAKEPKPKTEERTNIESGVAEDKPKPKTKKPEKKTSVLICSLTMWIIALAIIAFIFLLTVGIFYFYCKNS
ncbi:hypothetical protein CDIK_2103 [Cucumispora dikerogammari]|nr:hypothetical protein CDIK_2103 [Cucumispora dikerogammari]